MKVDYALKWEKGKLLRDLKISDVEKQPGVYVLFLEEECETRYVGKASNCLWDRLREHLKNHRFLCCKENCHLKATWACWRYHDTQPGALSIIEMALISELNPTSQDIPGGIFASVTLPDYALKRYR